MKSPQDARRRAGALLSAGASGLWGRANRCPRSALAILAGLVALALTWMSSAPAAAAPGDSCGGGISGTVCSIGNGLADAAQNLPGVGTLKGLYDTASKATNAVDTLNPQNFLDSWAQGLCHAVIFVLTFIEATAEKLGEPAFNQQWWASQYAVSFGLALIVLAFLLAVVTARIGGSEGSVSGVELLRQSGWRFIFVVPACALAPACMYSVQQVADALTKSFATRATIEGNGAVGALLKLLDEKAGNGWGDFGGTVMVIALLVPVLCCGVVLLVEVAVSNWGLMVCGLLVPLALVSAVYPPWTRVLRRLCGLIIGLMFLPTAIFFFFWMVWSGFNANAAQQGGSNSSVTMLVFLLVSLIAIDAFPVLAVWLLGVVAPGAEQMDAGARTALPSPNPGDVYSGDFQKLYKGDASLERSQHGNSKDGQGSSQSSSVGSRGGPEDSGATGRGPDTTGNHRDNSRGHAGDGREGSPGRFESGHDTAADSRGSVPGPDDPYEDGTRAGSHAGDDYVDQHTGRGGRGKSSGSGGPTGGTDSGEAASGDAAAV